MSGEQLDARTDLSTTDRTATIIIFAFAAVTVLAHCLVGNRYGFQRDELQTLDDARHLAWGYVAYPALTPLFGRLSLTLFGTSLRGFRFFASLALAASLLISARMAGQSGGRRGAQLLTVFALLPAAVGAGMLMQYVAFDFLCWVLVAYFVVRLLTSGDPRWWLAIGAAIGCGMEAKYTMGFLARGVATGTLLTDARRYLRSKWLWMGVAVSVVLFLPNLAWQARHGFVSFDFLSHIHARDIRLGRTKDFLPDQFENDAPGGAAVDRRSVVFPVLARGRALPAAGVDVRCPAAALCRRQGSRLLPPAGLSDAVRRWSGLGRAAPPSSVAGVEKRWAHRGVACAGRRCRPG
ncbi:MAG TPA: glycosyltransferase family 39 protein [Terriglobales bacterium]|nr:glycosyltransferase family 39 protein [Terriglobales bacterium]